MAATSHSVHFKPVTPHRALRTLVMMSLYMLVTIVGVLLFTRVTARPPSVYPYYDPYPQDLPVTDTHYSPYNSYVDHIPPPISLTSMDDMLEPSLDYHGNSPRLEDETPQSNSALAMIMAMLQDDQNLRRPNRHPAGRYW